MINQLRQCHNSRRIRAMITVLLLGSYGFGLAVTAAPNGPTGDLTPKPGPTTQSQTLIRSTAPESSKLSLTSKAAAPKVAGAKDQQLQRLLRHLLHDDPQTRSFAGQATVRNGRATLVGQTFHPADRVLAEKLAARVPGLLGVQNLIVVEPNPDLEIARKLHEAFSEDLLVDDATIGVTVIHRKVFLSGPAVSSDKLTRINQIALSVPGVASVSNGLKLAPVTGYRPVHPPLARSNPAIRR